MTKYRKLFISVLLLFTATFFVIGAAEPAAESDKKEADEGSDDLALLGNEMAGLWEEKSCAAELTSKFEEPVISIACNADYPSAERDKVLDYLFKKGFLFRKESYDIKGSTGHYWYRFERRDGNRVRAVYVRLHVTSQGTALWGSVKPASRIAVYVDNLATADELTAWQTLGVPLTFGLKPADGAKELASQIEEYKQETWLALDLRQGAFSEPDQSASIKEVLEQDMIGPYLKNALEQTGDVWGFVIRDLNSLTTTVASARAIFAAMKAEEKRFVLLPARYNKALNTTANVMDMTNKRVTYDMTAMCSKSPAKVWPFLRANAGKGDIIARFPASAKRCAHTLSRTLKRDGKWDFKTLSVIFGYKEKPDPKGL